MRNDRPPITKIALIVLLCLALIFLGAKIFSFWRQEKNLEAELEGATEQLAKAQAEGAQLASDTQYLANPANLEKELRSRFNYKKPGESMIIIVPAQGSSTASGTD